MQAEADRIWETGDTLVVAFSFHAKGRESGAVVDMDWLNVYAFEGNVATGARRFSTIEEALEREGLPPDLPRSEPAWSRN
jgi:hypothetical protein